MENSTLNQMNEICAEIARLRGEETRIKFEAKGIADALEIKEKEVLDTLVANELKSYRSPSGLASLSFRTSVKTPKTDEDRSKFFEYLKSKGIYDAMISVNSMTLNSWYKEEFAGAEQAGTADTFEIPGLTEVTVSPILSFRK